MIMHPPSNVLTSVFCIATASLVWASAAQARQQCSAAAPADQHGYWSWRMIDGRKCWYEGKPMLSRSLLEWPAQTAARPDSSSQPAAPAVEERSDPLDAQAWAPAASDTFDAMWRDRIEQH